MRKTQKEVETLETKEGLILINPNPILRALEKKKIPKAWLEDAGTFIVERSFALPGKKRNDVRCWVGPNRARTERRRKLKYGDIELYHIYIGAKRADGEGGTIRMCHTYFKQAWGQYAWWCSKVQDNERQFCFCTLEIRGQDYLKQLCSARKL